MARPRAATTFELLALSVAALLLVAVGAAAEDSDRARLYLGLRIGESNPVTKANDAVSRRSPNTQSDIYGSYYITAQIVGGKVTMLGNIVQTTYVTNLPFAAAVATIPVIIVLLYLLAVRRSGALDNL